MDASKLININDKEQIKHLNFDKLFDDAETRGDVDALKYLMERAKITDTRTSKKGKEYIVGASFIVTRNEYLEKFLGWKPAEPEPKVTFAQAQAARMAKIGKALKAIEKAAAK